MKFNQTGSHFKGVVEAAKLAYTNKTKESITFQKPGSRDFWRIANGVLNKDDSGYLLYIITMRCCRLHLIKQNCLLKTFLRTTFLITQVSL